MLTVAVIGCGIIGKGIINNLKKSEFNLRLYNRTRDRLMGIARDCDFISETPSQAADGADVVIVSISDDNASNLVWFGENGILQTAKQNTICIECSTLSAKYIDYWVKEIRNHKLVPIDCPVTGSKPGAETGTLSLFVGAEKESIDRAKPIFDCISKEVFHIGPPGHGMRFKLVYNMLSGTILCGLAEALGLAQSIGLNMELVGDILSQNGWSSLVGRSKAANIINGNHSDIFCSLNNLSKDLIYAMELAENSKQVFSVSEAASLMYRNAVLNDKGELDMSAIGSMYLRDRECEQTIGCYSDLRDSKYLVYLNTGTSGVYSKEVIDTIYDTLILERAYGGGHKDVLNIKESILLSVREKLTKLISADIEEMVLTSNTTEGVNIVAHGFDFHEHDEVIITNQEHYSCLVPWRNIKDSKSIIIRYLNIDDTTDDSGNLDNEKFFSKLRSALTSKTRLVFISHILYTTGVEIPIASLSRYLHEYGIELLVDGAQSIGHVQVNVKELGCDYYAFTGSKWLNGPSGTGGLYINKARLSKLRHMYSGWNSVSDPSTLTFREDGRSFEVSTKNMAILKGLETAVDELLESKGRKFSYIVHHADLLRELFSEINTIHVHAPNNKNGIITFSDSNIGYKELYNKLTDSKIICRTIDELRAIRFSIPNNIDDKKIHLVYNIVKNASVD